MPLVLVSYVIFTLNLLILARPSAAADVLAQNIQPFGPDAVRLNDKTFAARAASLNQQYLLSLNVDSLLWTFRQNAGLPAHGNPFSGSWEDPACEVRGQFLGHYLSATARLPGMSLQMRA